MNVDEFYKDMLSRGFQFQANGDQLKCRGTLEPFGPELIQQLRLHKKGILSCLKAGQLSFRSTQLNEASRLLQERGWIQIWAGYLNQHIYLVRDETVKIPDPTLAKYTQAEIEALKALSMEEIQTLHEAKIIFKGTVKS